MDNYLNIIKSSNANKLKDLNYKNFVELINRLNFEQRIDKLQNNINNLDDIDFIQKYEVEKIVEEQKQNEKLMEQLDEKMNFFDMVIFRNNYIFLPIY